MTTQTKEHVEAIDGLLERLDYAGTKHEGQPWAPVRTEDVDAAATEIRRLQGLLLAQAGAGSVCARCEAVEGGFSLSAHVERVEARGSVNAEFARRVAEQAGA